MTDEEPHAVALGGTFDPIHDGHRALFYRAFRSGDVTIGLTSDELAAAIRDGERSVTQFEDRASALADELESWAACFDRSFEIRELSEPTAIADEPPFDILVVSPETEPVGQKINEIRDDRGLDPLCIEVVEHVRAEDGEIISSTRIIRGEIDEHGNLLD